MSPISPFCGGPSARSSDSSLKKCSKPAGLMISIIWAGTLPAFHMVCISPRGFVMYPPGPSTTSRSPERKPISPSVTIEYSSSRVCRCGGTSAPTGNGCSTMETAPLVSGPQSLKSTPIEPRKADCPCPGWTTVRGGGASGSRITVMSVVLPLQISRYDAVQRNVEATVPPSSDGCQDLSEHQRSTKSRTYRMRKRADQMDEVRQRIVDAAVELH